MKARIYEAEGEQTKKLLRKYERKLSAFLIWFWTYRNKLCLPNKCFCGKCEKIGRKFSCPDPVVEHLRAYRDEVIALNPHIKIVSVTAEPLGSEVGQRHE